MSGQLVVLRHKQPPAEWLHLFTSTVRELYIVDAVDLLAAPSRAIFRFRYESRYLDDATRTRWAAGTLVGVPVALYFSLQHPADFHPATFIPLRRAEVVSTFIEGSTHVVYFRLLDYLPLEEDPGWESAKQRSGPVNAFADQLRELLGDRHPDGGVHAVLGGPPPGVAMRASDPGRAFETVVRYMTPSLYFSPRIYYRVSGIWKATGRNEIELDPSGSLFLRAGADYTLHVAHYQAEPFPGDVSLSVTVPSGVTLFGAGDLPLRSRYDVIPVSLFAPFRDDVAAGELTIKTLEPARGPTVRIPVMVVPSTGHSASGPLLGIGGAMALALPPVLGGGDRMAMRAGFAMGGTALAGLGLWLRRAKGLVG